MDNDPAAHTNAQQKLKPLHTLTPTHTHTHPHTHTQDLLGNLTLDEAHGETTDIS